MEKENQNITIVNQNTLVKKGLFYYVFFVLGLPFRGLFFILKKGWKYVSIYLGWIKEDMEYRRKQKDLNKILARNKLEGEII